MERHTFLRRLHQVVRPRNYLEIGVNNGASLALSRVPSIAVDPAFKVTVPIRCDVDLVKATSDEFFARREPLRHFRSSRYPWRNLARGRPLFGHYRRPPTIDLAFVDGMHLFEFALRDFMNVERHAHWTSVVVFDDMLPRTDLEAARERQTKVWAGDVFKLIPVLREYRPDLLVLPIDTQPTGTAIVLGADPASSVLASRYEEIVERWATPDPQHVPADVSSRRGALAPEAVLDAPFWPDLVRARARSSPRTAAFERLARAVAALAGAS